MPQLFDTITSAQIELFTELEAQAAMFSPILPEVEVDQDPDSDFGALYRVWLGMRLLGTFYQDLSGAWISQPLNIIDRLSHVTSEEAVAYIVAVA
jgi:hypothetical protein